MLHLSEQDRASYHYLLKVGVFRKVVPDKLPHDLAAMGAMLTLCADGDQFHDTYTHLIRVFAEHRAEPRFHILTRLGGGLVIPASSPLHHECHGLVDNIFSSRAMKNMDLVALYAHAPCGAATTAGMTLADSLENLCQAKFALKRAAEQANVSLKVVCLVHIDAGADEGKHTYHFPIGQWQLLTRHKPVKRGEPWPDHTSQAANS